MENMTRKQALSLGLHKYWTGKTCKNGHDDFRYVGTGACVHCTADNQRKYRPTKAGTTTHTFVVGSQFNAEFQERVLVIMAELAARSSPDALVASIKDLKTGKTKSVLVNDRYIYLHGAPVIEDGWILGHIPPVVPLAREEIDVWALFGAVKP